MTTPSANTVSNPNASGRATIACAEGCGRWVCQATYCDPTCPHELPPNAKPMGNWSFGNEGGAKHD